MGKWTIIADFEGDDKDDARLWRRWWQRWQRRNRHWLMQARCTRGHAAMRCDVFSICCSFSLNCCLCRRWKIKSGNKWSMACTAATVAARASERNWVKKKCRRRPSNGMFDYVLFLHYPVLLCGLVRAHCWFDLRFTFIWGPPKPSLFDVCSDELVLPLLLLTAIEGGHPLLHWAIREELRFSVSDIYNFKAYNALHGLAQV